MTYLLLQTFLLLLSAYFFGAFSACLAKRLIATRRERVVLVPAAVQPAVVVPDDVTPLVKPRPIERVQPKIDVFPRPKPHAVPAVLDISRFERALTGPDPNEGMPREMIVEIRPAVLESPTGPPVPFAPKPVVVEDVQPDTPEVTPEDISGIEEPHKAAPSQEHPSSGMAMATAAAAAAVAAARAAADAASSSYAKPARPEPSEAARDDDVAHYSRLEGSGFVPPPASSEPPAPASEDQEAFDVVGGDDLQSIRAIDADTEQRLKRLGVSTFAQIAHWTGEDIDYVAAALSLGGRIDEEEWVEQAQILARGGDTYYARTRAAALSPEDEAPSEPESDDAAEVTEAPESELEHDTGPAETEAAERDEPLADDGEGEDAGDSEPGHEVADAPVSVETASEAAEPTDGADASESTSEQVSGHGSAAATAAAVAAAAASHMVHSAPASTSPETSDEAPSVEPEPPLQEQSASGLQESERSVSEMAAAAAAAIAAASASVTRGLRPIEPISPLSRANPNVVMPTKLVDALRERDQKVQEGTQSEGSASVLSGASAAGEFSRPAPGSDDLKRIRGIGVLIERQLNANGITSYQQIANWSSTEIDAISAKLDFKGRIERENWVEQARILSSGGATEFSRRIDRGDGDN